MSGFLKKLFSAGRPLSLDPASWAASMVLPLFAGLSTEEIGRLEEQARQLLADKQFTGVAGFTVNAAVATRIAALASLPVLNIGYGWYRGWNEVVVYPAEFVPVREVTDRFGVVHKTRRPQSGEAWDGGPLLLSWADVLRSGNGSGHNVVIHEFAHKMDMRNGAVNGRPLLHSGLSAEAWATVFNSAYADFGRRARLGEPMAINPYGAESPAEFFAVLSEVFFETPAVLRDEYPAVYELLTRFYKQNPLLRLERANDLSAT